ncbi:MAG TPA: hypothetical protein VHX63_18095 [Acidobacteriaceae bacterium]|jgi:hypothetical protein|nr:hypothetical protein [Acidobacteriaceae bacterium]
MQLDFLIPAEHAAVLIEVSGSREDAYKIALVNLTNGTLDPEECAYWKKVASVLSPEMAHAA